ncbi:MAG: 30S ribosomal protein S4 [Candidatus Hodarchaeaceae archaeon]|nr:30S ribosomal protein S4 [Candidatus Hodarchaeaceae archaeon]
MKRQRKKYLRPSHPWEKDRMDAEDKLLRQYGLRRKEEIWRTETLLRKFRRQARRLLAASGPQAELEARQLLARLRRLGLVGEDASLDDVLGLKVENLLERRLQTLVFRKGLAKTPSQARQMILHGHISIGDRRVTVPSYLVPADEEGAIGHTPGSPFVAQPSEGQAAVEQGAQGETGRGEE